MNASSSSSPTITTTTTTTIPPTISTSINGDVLARIFSYLDWRTVVTCRAVCPSWRDAVAQTAVVELVVDSPRLAHGLLLPQPPVSLLPELQSLSLEHTAAVTDAEVRQVPQHFPQLHHLCLRESAAWHNMAALPILRQLVQLRTLNLHNCHYAVWNLAEITTALPHLRELRG